MISASKHVLFGFNLFHVSSLTNYVNSSMVAQNAFCLFKIPLNDAFLKGTVKIKGFRYYCKLPLAIHFHLKYFKCFFFLLTIYPIKFWSSLVIRYSSKITFTLDKIISVPFLLIVLSYLRHNERLSVILAQMFWTVNFI